MTFDEIDLRRAVWTDPGKRMKMGKPHDIPLSDQALAILRSHTRRAARTRMSSPAARCERCRTWRLRCSCGA